MKLLAELGQEVYRCNDCVKWLPTWQDLQLYPDAGGYSHEGHNVITKISRKQREVINGHVTFECKRCGEDVTFEFIADDGTRMYSEADGVLVCDGFPEMDEHGEYSPVHTIKEAS
mgnify:CR=1 FL=1